MGCLHLTSSIVLNAKPSNISIYVDFFNYSVNCKFLKERDWNDYPQLECIRINQGLFKPETINKLVKRGVKVYIDDADGNDEVGIDLPKEKHKKAVPKPTQ